jgi:hypothetical protein
MHCLILLLGLLSLLGIATSSSHAGRESDTPEITCPGNPLCLFLPIMSRPIPEVDVPLCRWAYIRGSTYFISYKWGSGLLNSGSSWRVAFDKGLSSWNTLPILPYYYFASASNNNIDTYSDESSTRGITYITCTVGNPFTLSVSINGNTYWDNVEIYTDQQRQGIATHELGHGFSIGHIPQSYPTNALMYKAPPLEFFSSTYTPQLPDQLLLIQIFP